MHVAIERLLDGARRVDFYDLAQFLQTMLESVGLIRDGLLPPNKLIIETLEQTHGVVDNWIRNLALDNRYLPATDLVRFAAETASQVLTRGPAPLESKTKPSSHGPSSRERTDLEERESQTPQLHAEVESLREVSVKQSHALAALDVAVSKLESVADRVEGGRYMNGATKNPNATLSPTNIQGIDRETLATVRGKILKKALPSAYVVFKMGLAVFAARAADLAPLVQLENNSQKFHLALLSVDLDEVPTSLEVDSVEGFFNISDEQVDQDVLIQGVIPRRWLRGIMKWQGETVSLVDIKGFLKEAAQREGKEA